MAPRSPARLRIAAHRPTAVAVFFTFFRRNLHQIAASFTRIALQTERLCAPRFAPNAPSGTHTTKVPSGGIRRASPTAHTRSPDKLSLPFSANIRFRQLVYVAALAATLTFGVLAWLRFTPAAAHGNWQYQEIQTDLERITALARMPDGSVVATLEIKRHAGDWGRGELVRLDTPNRRYTILAGGLYKPAGLLPHDGGIVLTQEFPDHPVLLWKDGKLRPLLMLANPESIAQTSQGRWLMIEDSANGRLLEVDPRNNYAQRVLATGFDAGEGVCTNPAGRIFVVDAKKTDLLELRDGKTLHISAPLRKPGFIRCTENGVWITEDATNNGRLWFYDYKTFHRIASHLHAPQSVLPDGDGVLVAEQGRSRLLRFAPHPPQQLPSR